MASPAHSVGMANISVTASPSVLIADGKSSTILSATIRGSDGQLVPDGTSVQFSTTLGTLDHNSVTSVSGVARARLTSASTDGHATVQVSFVGGGTSGAATTSVNVQFTTDRELAATDGNSRWLHITCSDYLIYSADAHMVEADGKHGAATFTVGALSVKADSLQYDLDESVITARNAVLKRGPYTITAAELRYELYGNTGIAILPETDTQRARSVSLDGLNFAQKPLTGQDADDVIANNRFRFLDLSTSRVVLSARDIAIDPGNVIQFKHATLYSDGKKVMSMPLHVMPLGTDQLFGEQVVGFGSDGLFLNIPYYYNLSPHSTGRIYLRNSAAATSGIQSSLAPTFGSSGSRPGVALDLQQTYTSGREGNGSFVLNGLTRSDWGGSWNHSQKIDSATNAFFVIDSPSHRSLFGSSNLSRQFNGFSANIAATADHDPGTAGFSYTSDLVNTYLQTNPRAISHLGLSSVLSFNVQRGFTKTTFSGQPDVNQKVATEGVEMRMYTAPIHPDKVTNITDSVTVGRSWSSTNSTSSFTVLGNLTADRQLPKKGRFNLNYNFTYDPLLSQLGTESAGAAAFSAYNPNSLQQDLSATCSLFPAKKLGVSFSTHYALPLHTTSLYSVFNYTPDHDWTFTTTGYINSYFGHSYDAMQFTVARRIFNRSIQFTYDTSIRKIYFDFGAGQF